MARRTSLFLIVCMLLILGLMQVKAQDAADELAGFVVIPGTSGTIEEEDDGVYTLTLEGVGENLTWVLSAPQYGIGWYITPVFVAQWTANTETPLTTTALLKTETVSLRMTASLPTYDPMTSTLTIQISDVEAFPVEEGKKKGGDIPDEFEMADLSFVVDSAFAAGLSAGNEVLISEGRTGQKKQNGDDFTYP